MNRRVLALTLPLLLGACSERMVEEVVKVAVAASDKAFSSEAVEAGGVMTAMVTGVVERTAVPITLGEVAQGSLTDSDPVLDSDHHFDTWTIDLAAPADVVFSLTSADFDTYLLLYQGDAGVLGRQLGSNDDFDGRNSRLVQSLTAGMYTVIVRGFGTGSSGAYTLAVELASGDLHKVLKPDQPAQSVLSGEDDGVLNDGSPYDDWYFTGSAGDLVTFEVESDDFDTYLQVLRDDRVLKSNNDDDETTTNSSFGFLLPANGAYVVRVTTWRPEDRGSYTLEARPLLFGDSFEGFGSGGDPSGRYALLVGIDHAPGSNDLAGPVEDARAMEALLVEHFGFADEDVVVLTDDDATRRNIARGIEQHLGQAGRGGTAVFFFSGHGAQLPMNIGLTGPFDPESATGGDQAIAVYGYEGLSTVILDEELGYLVETLDAERKLVVVDACFSGEITRGMGSKALDLSDTLVAGSFWLPTDFITSELAEFELGETPLDVTDWSAVEAEFQTSQTHVQWAAATETQESAVRLDREISVFTEALVRRLRESAGTMTLAEVHDLVHDDVLAYTQATPGMADFNPQIRGFDQFMSLDAFFGRR